MVKIAVYKLDEAKNLQEIDKLRKQCGALEAEERRMQHEIAKLRKKIDAISPILAIVDEEAT